MQQTLEGVEKAPDGGIDSIKPLLVSGDGDWSVVVLGPELSSPECVEICTWLSMYLPHARCLMVVQEGHLQKLIDVKNQVTVLSAIQFPWDAQSLRVLVDDLVARSETSRREQEFLGMSLAQGLTNVRQTRVTTLYQLLGQVNADGPSDRLLGLIEAAIALQDDLTQKLMGDRDLLSHVRTEATRMAAILAHVRDWHSTFQGGLAVRSLHGLFTVQEGSLVVRDILDQLQPLNGPVGVEPTPEQCCLLALLTWPPSRAALGQRADGAWVVRVEDDVA